MIINLPHIFLSCILLFLSHTPVPSHQLCMYCYVTSKTLSKLHISTVLKPPKYILSRNLVQGRSKGQKYILITEFHHCQVHIITIASQMILHRRKCQLNWVVIWRVSREKLHPHPTTIDLCRKYPEGNMQHRCTILQPLAIWLGVCGSSNCP